MLPAERADIVADGYVCTMCSMTAHAINGSAPRQEPRPRAYLLVGLVLLVIAALMWRAGFDIDLGTRDEPESLFIFVGIAAISALGLGYFRWLDRA